MAVLICKAMGKNARKQILEQLHERRKQVVRLHNKAMKIMQIVAVTGLSTTIDPFDASGGSPAYRGRNKADGLTLSQIQEGTIQRTIINKRPGQLKMDFCF